MFRKERKSTRLFLTALIVSTALACVPVFASEDDTCDHDWQEEYSYYDYVDANTCKHVVEYECYNCWETKTETSTSAHKWKASGDPDDYDYTKISATQHSYKQIYHCENCYDDWDETGIKSVTIKQNHTFDKYGRCTKCYYAKSRTITAKSGKVCYVNPNTWVKFVVKKDGYITLKSRYEGDKTWDGYIYGSFYNSKKKKFAAMKDSDLSIIPVKKGTYYLRFTSEEDQDLKYTFTAVKNLKNYTVKKAKAVAKNKVAKGCIYCANKKSTWTRYYKITLKKKQYLKLYLKHLLCNSCIDVYPAKSYDKKYKQFNECVSMSSFTTNNDWYGRVSMNKLPKGTYYVVIDGSSNWNSVSRKQDTGEYYAFKWK